MDRDYYYQNRTKEHQGEISQELATRNLQKDLERTPLTANQAKRLVLRIAPVVIVITILILLNPFG